MQGNKIDVIAAVAAAVFSLTCTSVTNGGNTKGLIVQTNRPVIRTDDVDRFFRIYDAAGGRPTAEQLQRDYLDQGSDGLRQLAKVRNVTGVRIADAIAKTPAIYTNARECVKALPRVRERLAVALATLVDMYPEARLPPVTIAVGRGKPVGVGGPDTGVQIGLEALCATHWMNPNVEDRFVYVIAHEYAHVQQSRELGNKKQPTVLEISLIEGVAELVAELTAGRTALSHFGALTEGREKEIETAFVADVDETDLSAWVFNSTHDKPGDLGYWIGYRVAKAYYQNAIDKRAALRELLEMTDAKALLAKSGWYPGMRLK